MKIGNMNVECMAWGWYGCGLYIIWLIDALHVSILCGSLLRITIEASECVFSWGGGCVNGVQGKW